MSVAHGFPLPWSIVLASTTPRWLFLTAVLPFVLLLATRFPIVPLRWQVVVIHVTVFLAISFVHAVLDTWALGIASPQLSLVFSWSARVARSWYSTMPSVMSMYAAVGTTAWGIGEARERQLRTLRASQLETQLQSARLAALRAQLHPHFLYNTLNGIAALVADVQPKQAVAAIEQLSELLHASLRDDGRDAITVREEITLAERYLALQKMRFDDRLKYKWDIAPEVESTLVPVFLLQPIVENAVVHGLESGQESLTVIISAKSVRGALELRVENDGGGLVSNAKRTNGHGVGLSTTKARLAAAYGDHASLSLQTQPDGGAIVRIVIPLSLNGVPGPIDTVVAARS